MWPNPQFPADLVKFTEDILNEKLHFLCRDKSYSQLRDIHMMSTENDQCFDILPHFHHSQKMNNISIV